MTNNFFLVDLNESKTKQLAETITNDTSRKILNYLTEKEDTEAKIAETLGMPISTVHYHLQKLQEAGLVKVDEFHYSQKGREINHYKLANKYIIIAPQKVSGLREKLRGILPAVVIITGVGVAVQLYSYLSTNFATEVVQESAPVMARKMVEDTASGLMAESAPALMATAPEAITPAFTWNAFAIGFIAGGIVALGIYLLANWIWERRKK
jgi:DNA-binding transcriptional ArsR family regulator